jgi:hypothetical protein
MSHRTRLANARSFALLLAVAATLGACTAKPAPGFADRCADVIHHAAPGQLLASMTITEAQYQGVRNKPRVSGPHTRDIAIECRGDDFLAALPQ